jgi:hypothetical protein
MQREFAGAIKAVLFRDPSIDGKILLKWLLLNCWRVAVGCMKPGAFRPAMRSWFLKDSSGKPLDT